MLLDAVLALDEWSHIHQSVPQFFAVDLGNGLLGGLCTFEVYKTIALSFALVICSNLARQYFAELGECIVKSFVVDGRVKVLRRIR